MYVHPHLLHAILSFLKVTLNFCLYDMVYYDAHVPHVRGKRNCSML